MLKKLCQAALFLGAFSAFTANASLIEVDVELQLLTDVSGSVSTSEYNLQRDGYVAAFRNSDIIDTILAGVNGSIAVQYIEWSGSSQQSTQIDWFLIDSVQSANAFADLIAGIDRAFSNMTAIGSAINYGAGLFETNNFTAAKQVMDVSGDGTQNQGADTATARDAALAAGVDTINGITIGGDRGLSEYYQNNVIGGQNAFHMHAETFANFTTGIEAKLKREIKDANDIPEPSSIALIALAVLGLFGNSRKRKFS